MNTIGTVKIDIEKYVEWLKEESKSWKMYHWSKKSANSTYEGKLYKNRNEESIGFYGLLKEISDLNRYIDNTSGDSYRIDNIISESEYMKAYNIPYELMYLDPENRFCIFRGAEKKCYISPIRDYIRISVYENHDHISVKALALNNGEKAESFALSAGLDSESKASMTEKIEAKKQAIDDQKAEIKAQKEKMQEEIEQMKAEIEAKYSDAFAMMQKKMEELSQMKEKLENQLFLIDTEIYAYRLRNGENLTFTSLIKGIQRPVSEPITIFPKIRFLDEEMGKWMAVYDFDGSTEDIKYFEDILKHRPDLVELLCPTQKGVSFMKVSRTNMSYAAHPIFENQLQAYEKYHGKTIAVLIRNGDNLSIAWTDDDKVTIKGEDAFLQAKKQEYDINDPVSEVTSSKEDVASRYFLYNILQGVLDKNVLLPLPEKVSLLEPTPLIVLSYAEGWLETNPYGSLSEIIEKTDQDLKKGDMILTMSRITRDDAYRDRYKTYNNDRGIGDKNRTHDVAMRDCQIYPVNKIVTTRTYMYYTLHFPAIVSNEGNGYKDLQGPPTIHEEQFSVEDYTLADGTSVRGMFAEEILRVRNRKRYKDIFAGSYETVHRFGSGNFREQSYFEVYYDIKEEPIKTEVQYYVSLEKDPNWLTGKRSRANFEFYKGECLNLTFLNSEYILSAIMHRESYGRRDHASTLPYLNTALGFLRKREEGEKEMLLQYTDSLPDKWMVELSEWRLEHGYHTLTDTRAASFAKYLQEQGLVEDIEQEDMDME